MSTAVCRLASAVSASRPCACSSTALAAWLDPEDLREVIGAYHACIAKTVSRFDDFVAKYMGDGVLWH
jgi:class 3 adenylate cyclase